MKKTKTIKIIILTLILVIGVFLSWKYFQNRSYRNGNAQQTFSTKVQKGTLTSSVSASGQIQTANYLAVTTSVNGIVKQVFVKEGDTVIKGQKIMEITLDSEGEKSRLNAYSNYLKAKNTVEAAKNSLYALNVTLTQKEEAFDNVKETTSYQTHDERVSYELAENDYLSAKSAIDTKDAETTQLQLALNTAWLDYQAQAPIITAPESGVISNVTAVEGIKIENSVTSDRTVQTVAAIKKEGTPIASLNVSEADINKVKVGQKVNLTLTSTSDENFTGIVAGIDKIGTHEGGVSNYPVIVKFDTDSEKVLPNMGIEAEIVLEEKADVLYIPTSAIQTTRRGSIVRTRSNNGITEAEVVTGISNETSTEIVSGLNEEDEILVNTLPTTGFTNTDSSENSQQRPAGGGVIFGGGTFRGH